MDMDYYDVLGCDPDATDGELKDAYRRAALRHHPDRSGGSHEAMSQITEAWLVLRDPEKRQRYDRGESGNADPIQVRVQQILAATVISLISQRSPERFDLVAGIRSALLSAMDACKASHEQIADQRRKLEKVRARLRSSDEKTDLLRHVVEQQIAALSDEHLANEKLALKAALRCIENSTYDFEKGAETWSSMFSQY